ncbi:MAG: RNA polymerase sigma factor [Actinobacteria bacterium]|nr:RNA polymerase sigma factor [Actinomycetota bacterium]NIT97170.1 RNA polymerase sigma factor [Actinomycetota bacterium]NIU20842.1 RNA polymerase sigma factor [Actinomycetota bacterium]NIU68752.1 RNA polymerase sigma factor [Actinomycetota bacterium]NIV57347.1 sigma-70 family RNA polymerase sigma factor [Actinomycetota bacterium]
MIAAMSEPMREPAETAGWLAAAQRGDSAGFDAIYRWLAGPVTAFARARGADDPEGITNETFLRAFRSIDSFTGDGGRLRAWIFSIARNQLIDAHRRSQRRPDELFAPPPEGAADGADVVALERVGLEELHDVLSVLTDEQREVVLMRLVADLSLAETAEAVGRPVSAVKRLQARGLKRLQREILAREVS